MLLVRVSEYGVPNTAWDAPSSNTSNNGDPIDRDISEHKGLLRVGTNVLAVQVHDTSYTSSDLTFIPRLLDRTTTIIEGGANQVRNSSFDTDTSGWLIEGTHWRSGRTTAEPIEGSGSLKIIAAGRGDNKANRIETADDGLNMLDPISGDWEALYHHSIYFLETFVDPERFRGACYRAANWISLGLTTGRGKDDQTYKPNRSLKEVLAYPLSNDFREKLSMP